jgi:hypothetical protein
MKIYYNFNAKHRNFSLSPSGPSISTETENSFRPGVDDDKYRYYTDCNAVVVKGDKFKIYVIIYEDGERDYLGDDEKSVSYYLKEKEKFKDMEPKITQSEYYKFGYKIVETTYKYEDNLFMETQWSKE